MRYYYTSEAWGIVLGVGVTMALWNQMMLLHQGSSQHSSSHSLLLHYYAAVGNNNNASSSSSSVWSSAWLPTIPLDTSHDEESRSSSTDDENGEMEATNDTVDETRLPHSNESHQIHQRHPQQQQQQQQSSSYSYSSSSSSSSSSSTASHTITDHRPNILLLYADDWTMKLMNIFHSLVQTPTLSDMIQNGILFTNNCVTTSICWISRSSLVTGQYGTVHQHLRLSSMNLFTTTTSSSPHHANTTSSSSFSLWNQTLFTKLKQEGGYYTGLVGKWHAPSPPDYMNLAFDYRKLYYGNHYEIRNGTRTHVTHMNYLDAMSFLQSRPIRRPFALSVNFFAVHAVDNEQYPNEWQPQQESMKLYVNDTIPLSPTNTIQHWDDLPWFFTSSNSARGRYMNRFDTPEHYQVSMKNIYRMATEVDTVCGELIKELQRQGVENNTIIIFTTDNGVSVRVFFFLLLFDCICVLLNNNNNVSLPCVQATHVALLASHVLFIYYYCFLLW
jgi:hypothetical protein